ncbi:MAG: asparagine synthase (glutamine-hydrolyzing) [Geminicoccales bacterium]
MCGIAGFIDHTVSLSSDELQGRALLMCHQLAHRGPDDEQVWTDETVGVALGHRRLAIVDLSVSGRQPMASADGRYVLIYNGEIYNAAELRVDLEKRGHHFKGHSDTEVLIEGIAAFGVSACVQRLIGMFAFAVWDKHEKSLTLVRDRLGIKPLYWTRLGGLLLFGSELKALRAYPDWQPEVDRYALALFMRDRVVSAPQSIYQGVEALAPGEILEISSTGKERRSVYWNPVAIAEQGQIVRSDEEAMDQLEALLRDAVGRRMIADVPLGAFLSGGVDSSTVTAMMQAESIRPVKTFSIGFDEQNFDEAPFAKVVAEHLGTEHTELYINSKDALDLVPELANIFDEPFADASQIPTCLLAALTKKHVTVALSGDGGDELFAGYERYQKAEKRWQMIKPIPSTCRMIGADGLDKMLYLARRSAPGRALIEKLGSGMFNRLAIWSSHLRASNAYDLYQQRHHPWRRPEDIVRDVAWPGEMASSEVVGGLDHLTRMQLEDLTGYLPDDILTKVDRATMAVALEARVPILDHRVAEFALRLPREHKIRNGEGKWLLKKVLARHVPSHLYDRPKKGFSVPLASWLRGPLRDWAEDLLDEKRLREDGYFHSKLIRDRWQQHLNDEWNWQTQLWQILVFQAWLRHGKAA